MGLKLGSTSSSVINSYINYASPLIPLTGHWCLCYKQRQIGDELSTDNIHLEIINNTGKRLYWSRRIDSNVRTVSLVYQSGLQSLSVTHSFGANAVTSAAFIEYLPSGILRLWNVVGNTVISRDTPGPVSNAFSDMVQLRLNGWKFPVTNYPLELAIWKETNFTSTDVLNLANSTPCHYYRNFQPKLHFYERYFTKEINPYRLGGVTPTYSNVVEGDPTLTAKTEYCDTFGYGFRNIGEPAAPTPNEIIIDIVTSMMFTTGGNEQKPTFEDKVRFLNDLGSNVHYKQLSEALIIVEEIASNVKIQNLEHFMFLVEQWESEHATLTADQRGDVLYIGEQLIRNIELTRVHETLVEFRTRVEAYKNPQGQFYGRP